jgi:chromate transporter
MIFLELAWSFFKIGLFSFGGGYAMVPLMEREIAAHGWLAAREFADIVAISQMTPGPIAVNAATYIGFRVAGVAGSASATLGVFLPSLFLVLLVAHFLRKFKESPFIEGVLSGIRPATVGLIASAVVFFAEMSVFTAKLPFRDILSRGAGAVRAAGEGAGPGSAAAFGFAPGGVLNLGTVGVRLAALGIFLVILVGTKNFKLKPIPAVLLSAALGLALL